LEHVVWWKGGTGREEQYFIDQGKIQNKTKQWEEEVSLRLNCWVKITNLERNISD
jgi:hypothetical protein